MHSFIPYGRQYIDDSDIAAVTAVLRSDFLTSGPKIEEFESLFAAYVGSKHAVAVSSATAGLHIALAVAGISKRAKVLTSPITFVATSNAASFVGAIPDFVDIDPISFNLDPSELLKKWTDDVKAVIAVDYAGQPCDMPAIAQIARTRGAFVIEDASHAVGSSFTLNGRTWRVGGHPWADMTVFSFHPVKTMTTGEGGMLVTDNDEWAARARRLRSHGIERSRFVGLGASELNARGSWYYEMQELGWNYRMTDIQCALGISQLSKLSRFIERRRAVVAEYSAALKDIPGVTPPRVVAPACAELTSWHLYTLQIDFQGIGIERSEFMERLKRRGVGSQVLYIPVYLQPWYRQRYGYQAGKCPAAERAYLRALSIPLFPQMSDDEVERVIDAVHNAVAK